MATATLPDEEVLELAQAMAGNWKRMQSFMWFRESEIKDSDNWAIIYTHNRDSGLLDQSNAGVIGKAMMPFTEDDGDDPDVVMESHSHFLVGWIAGFSIRCLNNDSKPTKAFTRYAELHEATVENIVDAARQIDDEYELPDDWQYEVYSWLSDNDCGEIENRSDQGGYPSEQSLRKAFAALRFKQVENE